MVGLIGTIDDEVERREIVELGHRNAERARLLAGPFGGRRADDSEAGAHAFREEIEKGFRRAAGAESELHAVADVIERARGGSAFQGIGIERSRHHRALAYSTPSRRGPITRR